MKACFIEDSKRTTCMCIVKRPFVVGNNNNLTKNLSLDSAILVWTRGLASVGKRDSRNVSERMKKL